SSRKYPPIAELSAKFGTQLCSLPWATLSAMLNTSRLAVYLAFVVCGGCQLLGQTHSPAKTQSQKRFVLAVNQTLEKGVQASLPPHISTLLGIAHEQESPVKQGVQRTGTTVKGIDVSIANKNDVVLFVVDEAANDQTLYLTSPEG